LTSRLIFSAVSLGTLTGIATLIVSVYRAYTDKPFLPQAQNRTLASTIIAEARIFQEKGCPAVTRAGKLKNLKILMTAIIERLAEERFGVVGDN
jgi:hypothetical protein